MVCEAKTEYVTPDRLPDIVLSGFAAQKPPGTVRFQGFAGNLTLGELRCAAGGLEAVLLALSINNSFIFNNYRLYFIL